MGASAGTSGLVVRRVINLDFCFSWKTLLLLVRNTNTNWLAWRIVSLDFLRLHPPHIRCSVNFLWRHRCFQTQRKQPNPSHFLETPDTWHAIITLVQNFASMQVCPLP